MSRSFEVQKVCDINGVLYIPAGVPDIVENIFELEAMTPTQLFDDLYYVGTKFVGCMILKTGEGLVLIDAMNHARDGEEIIFKGMKELGLNPKDITHIIITHGHVDHYGAAKYIKEQTGCKVIMSEIDHKFMREVIVPLGRDDLVQGVAADPGIDQYVKDGDVVSIGGKDIKIAFTPGHTPGGISLVVPVQDGKDTHYMGIWGGTKSPTTLEDTTQYLNSIRHFMKVCESCKADVSVQIHPFVDYNMEKGIFDGKIGERKAGEPHPLVLGTERFQLFLKCIEAYAVGALEEVLNK